MNFRIYIEETSVRLLSRTVEADTREAAEALAHAALDDDTWTEWDHSASDAALEVRADLTGVITDGHESRLS